MFRCAFRTLSVNYPVVVFAQNPLQIPLQSLVLRIPKILLQLKSLGFSYKSLGFSCKSIGISYKSLGFSYYIIIPLDFLQSDSQQLSIASPEHLEMVYSALARY